MMILKSMSSEIKNHKGKIAKIIIESEELLRNKMMIREKESEALQEFTKEKTDIFN